MLSSPFPLRLLTYLSPSLTFSVLNVTQTHSDSSTESETDSILLNSGVSAYSFSLPTPSVLFPFETVFFLFSFFPFCSHTEVSPRMNLAGKASTPSQLPPPLLFLSSESAFPLRSHYPAGLLPAESRRQLSTPFSPPFSLAFIPPSSSSAALSLTIFLRVFEGVDVHSFDFEAAVSPGLALEEY